MTAVRVVLVNWNGKEFLAPCLQSVAAQDYPGGVQVTVVDNGSSDGSQAWLAEAHPEVQLLENPQNNYCSANNLAVQEGSTDLVLLLNTDTVLQPSTLSNLVQALQANPKAAGVAPKILYPDGRIYSTGIQEREDLYWVDRQQGEQDQANHASPEPVFGLSGCCVLYRRQAYLEAGGLNEDFHMYYEDVDLSLRLKAMGHDLLYVPTATMTHIGHGSINKTSRGKDHLGERNRLLVLAAHYPKQFAAQCVRSPWFQSAAPEDLRTFLPKIGQRLQQSEPSLDLLLALRDQVREYAGELDSAYGEHRNLPKILQERETWIARLLREVARLRIYQLPWKRLKPGEAAFLRRFDKS